MCYLAARWFTTFVERAMIIAKSKKEIEKMRAAGKMVGLVLQELRRMVRPGITTLEVDRAAESLIRDAGALPTLHDRYGISTQAVAASIKSWLR